MKGESTPSTQKFYFFLPSFSTNTVAFMDMGTIWGNTTRQINLETSLFDLKTGKRIWSGLTRTVLNDETDRLKELSKLVDKVLIAMRADGLVH